MRLSKFHELMNEEFGLAYAQVLLSDLVLTELADRTGAVALQAGEEPRDVWLAICKAQQVPASRWHGVSKPPRHA